MRPEAPTMNLRVALIACCLLLSGCEREIVVNHLKLIQNFGYDIEGDTIKSIATYPVIANRVKNPYCCWQPIPKPLAGLWRGLRRCPIMSST